MFFNHYSYSNAINELIETHFLRIREISEFVHLHFYISFYFFYINTRFVSVIAFSSNTFCLASSLFNYVVSL